MSGKVDNPKASYVDVLTKNRRKFIKELATDIDDLFDCLIEFEVLNVGTKNSLMEGCTGKDQARKLLDHLSNNLEIDIKKFVKALKETEHDNLVALFDGIIGSYEYAEGEQTTSVEAPHMEERSISNAPADHGAAGKRENIVSSRQGYQKTLGSDESDFATTRELPLKSTTQVSHSQPTGTAGKASIFVFDHVDLGRAWSAPVAEQGLSGPCREVGFRTMPQGRYDAAVALYNGQVWVVGGDIGDFQRLSSCLVLDTKDWIWQEGPALMEPRECHKVTVLDDCLVAVGGFGTSSCEVLQAGSREWRILPAMDAHRWKHAVCECMGKLWVCGGQTGTDDKPLSSMVSLGLGDTSWKSEARLGTARYRHSMAGLGDRLLVCGGTGHERKDLLSVEMYDMQTQVWVNAQKSLPEPKSMAALVIHQDSIYIIGGWQSTSILCYNGQWQREKHPLPEQPTEEIFACILNMPHSQ